MVMKMQSGAEIVHTHAQEGGDVSTLAESLLEVSS